MEEIRLETLDDFDKAVGELRAFVRSKREEHPVIDISAPLFRGQASADWPLLTTLDRYLAGRSVRVDHYHRFLCRIRPEVESYTGKRWDIDTHPDLPEDSFRNVLAYEFMVYVRHHGFPSPLLDWTRSPYIALFFAYEEAVEDEDVAVYGFIERPDGLKVEWGGGPTITEQGPYATTHPRHFMQQAMYTICVHKPGEHWTYFAHEDYFRKADDSQDYLRKYVLPGNLRVAALSRLLDMNINAHTLFANEEGLIRALAFKEMIAPRL